MNTLVPHIFFLHLNSVLRQSARQYSSSTRRALMLVQAQHLLASSPALSGEPTCGWSWVLTGHSPVSYYRNAVRRHISEIFSITA